MRSLLIVVATVAMLSACSSEKKTDPPTAPSSSTLTYYGDALPIFEQHCLECHQAGGIAPFRLDQYGEAKKQASAIADATHERAMPPWAATSDGTCQTFSHSLALSDAEIATLSQWAAGGAAEGTPRAVVLAERPTLGAATEFATPEFAPVAQGGDLAEFDEYRCFLMDPGIEDLRFITGYEVVPGSSAIVHHVLVALVDPDAASDLDGQTNGEVMAALDAESPDRDGWPCFGMAGDNVEVESVPVVWAPGQGVVEYPGDSGVPIVPGRRLVVQVHYNLADNPGAVTDRSVVRLRLVSSVSNVGVFVLHDPFLDTLFADKPYALEPGQASVKYTWQKELGDFFGDLPNVKLYGIMPHMHQRGRKYRMNIGPSSDRVCGVDVQSWDFHFQHMYFYSTPLDVSATTNVQVTCDFDTSEETMPVLPGWGTRNEMCLATMYFTVPASELMR